MKTNKILNVARDYFVEVLGEENTSSGWEEPWEGASKLPIFLRNLYEFYYVRIFDKPCLLMLSVSTEGETPAAVRKHWQVVAKHFSGDIIYVVDVVSSFNRKRLIEQKVPFLVPGNQLYLPMLGIDLREYFKQTRRKISDHIGAVSQALVLRQIQVKDCSGISSRELAHLTGYSPMSITRALKELPERDLASIEKVGREKHLVFNASGSQLWQMAKPLLQSPVRKRVWVWAADIKNLLNAAEARIAGESALAHYTMLAEPPTEVIAVNAQEWPGIRKLLNIEELDGGHSALRSHYASEPDVIEIEQWSYSPGIITGNRAAGQKAPIVDPLSLWLSLRSSQDERIEMACEELIEHVWEQLNG
jgi:DNA-binding MarR family transcriptional regulator